MKFKPNCYLAFVLDEKSKARLLDIFPPKYSKVYAHHSTIQFKITSSNLEDFSDLFGVTKIDVYGYAHKPGVECAAVSINGNKNRRDGSFYHITISVQPPHKPVESNNLKNDINFLKGHYTLTGEVKLVEM